MNDTSDYYLEQRCMLRFGSIIEEEEEELLQHAVGQVALQLVSAGDGRQQLRDVDLVVVLIRYGGQHLTKLLYLDQEEKRVSRLTVLSSKHSLYTHIYTYRKLA